MARLENSARLFNALGDETRLVLVSRLCERGPQSISQLTSGTDITRQAVTKHLKVMEEAGLVHGHKHGREQIWELETKRLEVAKDFLNLTSKRWDDALERLRRLVES